MDPKKDDYQFEHPPKRDDQLKEANLPERDDVDEIQPSGPVPLADLSTANAVIDQERKKVRELEEKLATAEKSREKIHGDYVRASNDWAKETHESARWRQSRNNTLWCAGLMLVLLVGLAIWSINEHLTEYWRGMGHAAVPISEEDAADRHPFPAELIPMSELTVPVYRIDKLRSGTVVNTFEITYKGAWVGWICIESDPDKIGSWYNVSSEIFSRLKKGDQLPLRTREY